MGQLAKGFALDIPSGYGKSGVRSQKPERNSQREQNSRFNWHYGLTISEVARQVGLQASAIRYYEQIGLLPPAQRVSGQRRYDATALYRLATIQRARQLGFTLDEIRELFFGFGSSARASARWRTLSQRKLAELDHLLQSIKAVQQLLKKMMRHCHCDTLDQCGKGIFLRQSALSNQPTARRDFAYGLPLRSRPQTAQHLAHKDFGLKGRRVAGVVR